MPKEASVEAIYSAVTEQLTSKAMAEAERDRELSDEPVTPATSNKLARPEAKEVAFEWLMTLRPYTVALKNLEEISAGKKETHFATIIDAWARVVLYFIMVARAAFESGVEVSGIKIDLSKDFGQLKPFILRCLFISGPMIISGQLRTDLGTEKLRNIVANTDPSGNAPIAIRFLNESLYLDLRLPGFAARTRRYKDSLKGRRYFSESLLVKLQEGYMRFPLEDDAEDNEYLTLLAELTAELSGKRGAQRDQARGWQMQEIKKRQLIEKLKGD
jgi:hypothetical protein